MDNSVHYDQLIILNYTYALMEEEQKEAGSDNLTHTYTCDHCKQFFKIATWKAESIIIPDLERHLMSCTKYKELRRK